jgi:putative peptidoglycan lipid II flippase
MRRMLLVNAVSGLQVGAGFAFHVLLARTFGASVATDVYFVAVTIIEFVALLGASFTEMFVQFYHDLKVKDARDAAHFYQAVVLFSLVTGMVSTLAALGLRGVLVAVFTPGFDAERLTTLHSFFGIAAVSLIWSRVLGVNTALLNAEMHFLVPPIIALVMPLANIIALHVVAPEAGINAIAVAIIMSTLVALAAQQIYISQRLGIPPGLRIWHPGLPRLITGSLALRLGHQIWNSKDIVITHVLSGYGTGSVALYFYAARIISALFTITNATTSNMVVSLAARCISRDDLTELRRVLRKGWAVALLSFAAVLIPVIVVLPSVLEIMFPGASAASDRRTIYRIFMALIPFYVILTVELPLVNVIIALKRSRQIAMTGMGFLASLVIVASASRSLLGLYALPAALAVAQAQNLAVYTWVVRGWLGSAPRPAPAVVEEAGRACGSPGIHGGH